MKESKFQAIPEDFVFFDEKISINKLELIKSITSEYILSDKSYDKENRKFEDVVVNDISDWIKNSEMNLKDELKIFYEDLNY